MKRLSFVFVALIAVSLFCDDLTAAKPREPSLDILINGNTVEKSARDCDARYEALCDICEQYERPFTVLDLGAREGYYSFRIAEEFPDATVVMVEDNTHRSAPLANFLSNLCAKNQAFDNVILLNKRLSVQDMKTLSECEHFDIVLVMDNPKYLGHPRMRALANYMELITQLGDHTFFEVPDHAERHLEIVHSIEGCEEVEHFSDPETTLFHKHLPKDMQKKSHWFAETSEIRLTSDYNQKCLFFENGPFFARFNMCPGISLVTFKVLGGAWPLEEKLIDEIVGDAFWASYPMAKPWELRIMGSKGKLSCPPSQLKSIRVKKLALEIAKAKSKREIQDLLDTLEFSM